MIRLANINDAKTIVAFNANLALETEALTLNIDTLTNGVDAILNDPSKGCYYVYEVNGKVIGQLMITYEWSDWRNANFFWIQSVYVDINYRRQGIFQALYHHVKGVVEQRNDICGIRLYVEKSNQTALSTYQKLGMSESHYLMYEWKK